MLGLVADFRTLGSVMEPGLAILTTLIIGTAVAFSVMIVLAVRRQDWDELSFLLIGLAAAALAAVLDTLLGTIHSPWHIGYAIACVILGIALIEWRAWRRTLATPEKFAMMALWGIALAIFYVVDFWICAALIFAAVLYASLRPQTAPLPDSAAPSRASEASSAAPDCSAAQGSSPSPSRPPAA